MSCRVLPAVEWQGRSGEDGWAACHRCRAISLLQPNRASPDSLMAHNAEEATVMRKRTAEVNSGERRCCVTEGGLTGAEGPLLPGGLAASLEDLKVGPSLTGSTLDYP
ncbi:hypothetical protein NDU88_000421 [Pleurodeles waltl]|uniref:Uncharacterized protein n=1 Tax=Pleurodeles waltl TaxID=8319 RepID=A0AAV7UPY7_PLEWA|nr:hypothetical protein NDU88_000421 [Pleurodeles waltl]